MTISLLAFGCTLGVRRKLADAPTQTANHNDVFAYFSRRESQVFGIFAALEILLTLGAVFGAGYAFHLGKISQTHAYRALTAATIDLAIPVIYMIVVFLKFACCGRVQERDLPAE